MLPITYVGGLGNVPLTSMGEDCDMGECEQSWPEEDLLDRMIPPETSSESVVGRLRTHSDFWTNQLQASSFVQEIVTTGYRLPFLQYPVPIFMRNHKSTLEKKEFVESAIKDLVAASCVIECKECPTVCSPLLVVQNAKGKNRLVIDLRAVNLCLPKRKFKYEGLNLIPDLFSKGDHVFTFDLKSGYHHVDINKDCWPYLGFSWEYNGVRKFYMFRVLPFGLSTACYVFTKLLRPLIKRWRSLGLRIILYIDDGICAARTGPECSRGKDIILSDLREAGLVVNYEKSMLVPAQVATWLGFIVDLQQGVFVVPPHKIQKLRDSISRLNPHGRVPVRMIASITGQIISMSLAMGPITRLHTRALYAFTNQRWSWYDKLPLPIDTVAELEFWKNSLTHFNGSPIWFSPGCTRIAYSDASGTGYGGYVVELGNEVSSGLWSPEESVLRSTWRELKAVFNVLTALAAKLRGHKVKWFTDNQGVVSIITNGSKKPHLQEGALSIFEVCMQNAIKVEMVWLPRSDNEKADSVNEN